MQKNRIMGDYLMQRRSYMMLNMTMPMIMNNPSPSIKYSKRMILLCDFLTLYIFLLMNTRHGWQHLDP